MKASLAGFNEFVRGTMGISTANLPTDSPYIGSSYNWAIINVNRALRSVRGGDPAYPTMYAMAVYNLAGHWLISWTPDQASAEPISGSNPPQKYFAYMRSEYDLLGFTSGVVSSASDESTSVGLVVPKALEELTIGDLMLTKTPWGVQYLAIAQQYGPSIWGLTR
jgi:hypothetical protein